MNIKIDRTGLSKKQLAYLDSKEDFVLFGGARGGGKTHVNRILCVESAFKYPGRNILFVRPTIKSAGEQLTVGQVSKIIPRSFVDPESKEEVKIWKFDAKNNVYKFANGPDPTNPFDGGSRIILGGITSLADAEDQYQGIEFAAIIWDELTKSQMAAISYVIGSLRDTEYDVIFRAASNPGGRSHSEVKELYVDPWTKLKDKFPDIFDEDYREKISWNKKDKDEFTGEMLNTTYAYIPATLDDNPIKKIRDNYKRMIAQEPNEATRKAYRVGSWDTFRGRFWDDIVESEFFLDKAEVLAKYNIDMDWEIEHNNSKIFMSMDWGYQDFTCIHWHLETSKGSIITFKELYVNKKLMEEIALEVQSINDDMGIKPEVIYTPWDLYVRKGGNFKTRNGVVLGDELIDVWRYNCNVSDVKAEGNRIQGWASITKAIKNNLGYQEIVGGELLDIVAPKWIVLGNECPKLKRQLTTMELDPKNPEDIKKGREDHAVDCARMFWVAYMPSMKVKEKIEAPAEGTVARLKWDIIKRKEHEFDRIVRPSSVFDSDY